MGNLLNMSGGSLLKKGLPYDAEIEYLESSGTQWIDTLLTVSDLNYQNVNFIIEFARTTDNLAIFAGTMYQYYQFPIVNKRLRMDWTQGNAVGGVTDELEINTPYIVEQSNGVMICNGYSQRNENAPSSSEKFLLFAKQVNVGFNSRIYHFQVRTIRGNTKIIDLIPVRIGNVGYMYDKVSKQLFGNAGTGDFILGPDVN